MEETAPTRSVNFRGEATAASAAAKPLIPMRAPLVNTPVIIEKRRTSPLLAPLKANSHENIAVHLTTEYTTLNRPSALGSGPPPPTSIDSPTTDLPPPSKVDTPPLVAPQPLRPEETPSNLDEDAPPSVVPARPTTPDPSLLTLPAPRASSSAPAIDPSAPGTLPDGSSVFDLDIAALAEKTWRRPGSDLSDWFNYGFDEISWEAYCVRRRELGEAAAMLKGAVLVRVTNKNHKPETKHVIHRTSPRYLKIRSNTSHRKCGAPSSLKRV